MSESEVSKCKKCGGSRTHIQRGTNPGIVRCNSCGDEEYYCFDVAPARYKEDMSDGLLELEDAGSNLLAVAAAIRPLTGLTSQEALTLIRSGEKIIARRDHWRIWELENLAKELERLGARVKIVRG